jgi:hypothetical protein
MVGVLLGFVELPYGGLLAIGVPGVCIMGSALPKFHLWSFPEGILSYAVADGSFCTFIPTHGGFR